MRKNTFNSKKEIQEAIREQITTVPSQAIKAMLRVYEYQTEDEQKSESTSNLNGVGFTGTDAFIMTSFCKQYERKNRLSEKQVSFIMSKIGKYARQLTNHAIEKGMYVKKGKLWVVAV